MVPVILCTCLAFSSGEQTDLHFSDTTLKGWEGEGFHVASAKDRGFTGPYCVTSDSDAGRTGHKAMLHRVFTLPADAGTVVFSAYAVRGPNRPTKDQLDVALLAAGRKFIPKEVRTPNGWQSAKTVLPAQDGLPRQYVWRVSAYAGQTVRLVLVDEDDRPGCYLCCGGFDFFPAGQFEDREFSAFMLNLVARHQLAPMTRYASPHFTALSNAEEGFSEARLKDCEMLYTLFYDHFGRKGFPCRRPATKLMVAMFDSQAGFEAYLGQKGTVLTGIYHPPSNRMVIYDYGQNESLLSSKRQAEKNGQRIASYLQRQQYLDSVHRQVEQFRQTNSVGTIMHEVAHQLSFNCGMLNREGDVPVWLAEGLACYCEPTVNGSWQGIGEPDLERLWALSAACRSGDPLIGLQQLLESDRWLRDAKDAKAMLLGYAQSWALFRMLMEEQPEALKKYLAQIYARQVSERRLADFCLVFGSDLPRLERHYRDYMQTLAERYARPKKGPSH